MTQRQATNYFRMAVKKLTGAESIQERLFEAFLVLGPISLDDLPASVRKDWAGIKTGMSLLKAPAGSDEGDVLFTLRNTSDQTAATMAASLFDLLTKLEDEGK